MARKVSKKVAQRLTGLVDSFKRQLKEDRLFDDTIMDLSDLAFESGEVCERSFLKEAGLKSTDALVSAFSQTRDEISKWEARSGDITGFLSHDYHQM